MNIYFHIFFLSFYLFYVPKLVLLEYFSLFYRKPTVYIQQREGAKCNDNGDWNIKDKEDWNLHNNQQQYYQCWAYKM